ncbi:T9SS type A sorting domain-containing protein [Lewinella sp. IMCC34191]|uniref:DUF7619 domain-containing protein n=1 Tax=Lewinella sp. IMCC34191 TaxID=2259172 RepID=UPI000E239552|nr:T9SS type A sorting domain-containing protein [Lewinella sp. IMCC34191]
MRSICTLVLFATIWSGVAGQSLPFEIGVLDLNTDAAPYGIKSLTESSDRFLFTNDDGCVYRGYPDGKTELILCSQRGEVDLITSGKFGSLVATREESNEGLFRQYFYIPYRNGAAVIHLIDGDNSFSLGIEIGNKLLFSTRDSLYAFDELTSEREVLGPYRGVPTATYGERMIFRSDSSHYALLPYKYELVVTDGTAVGTRVVDRNRVDHPNRMLTNGRQVFYHQDDGILRISGSDPYRPVRIELEDLPTLSESASFQQLYTLDSSVLLGINNFGSGFQFYRLASPSDSVASRIQTGEAEATGEEVYFKSTVSLAKDYLLLRGTGEHNGKLYVTNGLTSKATMIYDRPIPEFSGHSVSDFTVITDTSSTLAMMVIDGACCLNSYTSYDVYDSQINPAEIIDSGRVWGAYYLRRLHISDDLVHLYDAATTGGKSMMYDRSNRSMAAHRGEMKANLAAKPALRNVAGFAYVSGEVDDAHGIFKISETSGTLEFLQFTQREDDFRNLNKELFALGGKAYVVSALKESGAVLQRADGGAYMTEVADLVLSTASSNIQEVVQTPERLYMTSGTELYALHGGRVREFDLDTEAFYIGEYVGTYDGNDVFSSFTHVSIPQSNTYIPVQLWKRPSGYGRQGAVLLGKHLYRWGRYVFPSTTYYLHRVDLETGEIETLKSIALSELRGGYPTWMGMLGDKAYVTWNEEGRLDLFEIDAEKNSFIRTPAFAENSPVGGVHQIGEALYWISELAAENKLMRFDGPSQTVKTLSSLERGSLFDKIYKFGDRLLGVNGNIRDLVTGDTLYANGGTHGNSVDEHRKVGDRLVFSTRSETAVLYSLDVNTGSVKPYRKLERYGPASYHVVTDIIAAGDRLITKEECGPHRFMVYYESETARPLLIDTILHRGGGPFPLQEFAGKFYYPNYRQGLGVEPHYFDLEPTTRITGTVYLDENENGIRDATEMLVPSFRLTFISEREDDVFAGPDGRFTYLARPDTKYTIQTGDAVCYEPVNAQGQTTLDLTKDGSRTVDIGVRYTGRAPETTGYLESGIIRCNREVPFWLTVYEDRHCGADGGQVAIRLPEEISIVSLDNDYVRAGDGWVRWSYSDLNPAQQFQVNLELRMPSEEYAGQEIRIPVVLYDAQGIPLPNADTLYYSAFLRCAIDPNDKLTRPRRPEESNSNYTQLDETITYTIRFQNTGNDTAFTVRLEDKLSGDLDWETFNPITASHNDYQVTLREGGNLEVLFPNILLPDSNTNEPASHGFFTFEIMAKEGLDDFTAIENTAGIYFDFNQPVITNTVKNTLVETLDADADGYYFFEECNDANAAINPGVEDIAGNGIDENCDGVDGTTAVLNFSSTILELAPNPTGDAVRLRLANPGAYRYAVYNTRGRLVAESAFRAEARIDLSDAPAGVYLLRITDEDGAGLTRRLVRY